MPPCHIINRTGSSSLKILTQIPRVVLGKNVSRSPAQELYACGPKNTLRELGVAAHDKVVWLGRNSRGVVRGIHAVRKVGATAVPLNYRFTAEEAAYVIENAARHPELFQTLALVSPTGLELLNSVPKRAANLVHWVLRTPNPSKAIDTTM